MKPASQSELPAVVELLPSKRDSFPLVNIDALLNKAIDAKSAVEIMERLQVMRRELRAEQAKEAFDSAMAAFQSEVPVILKTTIVRSGVDKLYGYATFESILSGVKGLMQKHGFSFRLDTDVESKDGWVIASCRVVHNGGHSETSTAKFPLGAGTRAMSATQIYAAALTFASRRVFCNSFGIVTTDPDLDGANSRPKPPGPSSLAAEASVKDLASELWALLKPVRGEKKDWVESNNWLWREEVLDGAVPESAPNLTAKRFRESIDKAKAILGAK